MMAAVSVHPDTGQLLLSCTGRRHPRRRVCGREGALLPLSAPHRALMHRPRARRPLEDARVRHSVEQGAFNLVHKASMLRPNSGVMVERRHHVVRLKTLMEEHDNDPYGPENLYSGSCIAVHGGLVLHTAGPQVLLTELAPDASRRFPRAPRRAPATAPSCAPLATTPVYSLDTKEEGGAVLVAARHRLGAAVLRVEGEEGEQEVALVGALPCSKGAAASALLPRGRAATLDLAGHVNVWDIATNQVTERLRLAHLLEGEKLR